MPTHPPVVQNENPELARLAGPSRTTEPPSFIHHPPGLARHRRKCQVCHHPEREAIEDLFVHWHSPASIANFFDDIADDTEDDDDEYAKRLRVTWVAIYRHAYAVGLDEIRRRNLRFAFEHILEQAGDTTPTSASIMAAARAYAACVNNDGQWIDPPKRVLVTNITRHEPDSGSNPIAVESPAPFSECGGSTPLCHTASQLPDADSPVAPSGVHSGSFAGARAAAAAQSENVAKGGPVDASAPPTSDVIPRPAPHLGDGAEGPAVRSLSRPDGSVGAPSGVHSGSFAGARTAAAAQRENVAKGGPVSVPVPATKIRISPKSIKNKEKAFSNR
jgi:hypothetical protein